MRKTVDTLIHFFIAVFAFVVGILFFSILFIAFQVMRLRDRVNVFFHVKGLYHFREKEFERLNVLDLHTEAESSVSLTFRKNDSHTYMLPAKEGMTDVLLELKVLATSVFDRNVEFDFCISDAQPGHEEYVYLFLSPFEKEKELEYTSSLLWYKIPGDSTITMRLTGVLPVEFADTEVRAELRILKYR